MTDTAIRVETLSKRHHIGRARQRHDTLRDALVARLRAPLERPSSSRSSRYDNGPDTRQPPTA